MHWFETYWYYFFSHLILNQSTILPNKKTDLISLVYGHAIVEASFDSLWICR